MMAVDVRTEGGFSAGSRRLLFEGDYEHFERRAEYDISPDGRRFLMIRTPPESAPRQINIVLNWFDELKRLVPTESD